jgi:DNA-binding transcriptional regulator YiaG
LQTINPETGERFEDYRDIRSYRARKKINPLTGQNFKDDEEYQKYLKSKRDPGLPRLIKDRLEELNMSQVEFAKMIGISHGALSSYIHLRATPSDNYLLRIYEGCGRHLD